MIDYPGPKRRAKQYVQYIREQWKEDNVVTILTLDLSGAYDNVDHTLLLKKMKHLGIPQYIIDWTCAFLSDRTTYFAINNRYSTIYNLSKGLPQGSAYFQYRSYPCSIQYYPNI